VRAVTFVAPVEEEPTEAAATKDKKDKKDKKEKKDKTDKAAESDEPAPAPPSAVIDPATPPEPLPADEETDKGEQHDDHGKGHDKKK